MSADKRSVHTDALATLGTGPLAETEARDAIHLAVEPVIAGEKLFAGMHVGLVQNAGNLVAMRQPVAEKLLGIVDPFLESPIYPGERFWLVVYPRTITSLRHEWEHPDFPNRTGLEPKVTKPAKKEAAKKAEPVVYEIPEQKTVGQLSKEWLQKYADSLNVELYELIEHAEAYLRHGEYWVEGGRFEGEWVPDEFWDHYEVYTGKHVADRRGSFFSCSC